MGFRKGFVDALPILLGYFAVGFTVAVAAVANGHPVWSPVLLSLTHVSGTSQGAIVKGAVLRGGAVPGLGELVLLCLALNLRYVLLSLALAQKLDPAESLPRRMLMALGVTDEIVAVAISKPFALAFPYVFGLFVSSYLGWNAGTLLGAYGTSLLPVSHLAPLGIALYAMFIAIVTPRAMKSRPTLLCVAIAAALNIGMLSLPEGARPKDSLAMLVSGIAAAAAAAILFPRRDAPGKGCGEAGP